MADVLTVEEFKNRVQNMLVNLPEEVQRLNDGLALSMVPLIVNRLIDLGEDGKGKKLGKYSDNALPTFFYLHRGTGSGADAKLQATIKKKQKEEGKNFKGISYKEFREINNLPTNFVTLSFTGETLADVGVVSNVVNGFVVLTTIDAKGQSTKTKYDSKGNAKGTITSAEILDFLALRFGENLLALNEEEEKQTREAYDRGLQSIVNKYIGV